MWHGNIRLGDTIDIKFTTRSFSTGVPTTLAGSPVISAYPDNSTTQLTAGITLTVDFDSVTGLHNVRVVATSGNGYATATNYALVITTGTVGGVSVVGEVIGSFSIEARGALMPTVAGRTLDVSSTGEAGVDWANVGNQSTSVNLSGTTVNLANTVTTLTNLPAITTNWLTAAGLAADAVTEIQAGLSTLDAAGVRSAVGLASANLDTQLTTIDDFLDTEIAAIKTKTDSLTFTVAGVLDANIQYVNDILVTGVGTSASPWGP